MFWLHKPKTIGEIGLPVLHNVHTTEYERQTVFYVEDVLNKLKQALFVERSNMKHKVRLELNCFKDDSKMIIGLRASSSDMGRLKDSSTIFLTLPVDLLKNGQLQLGQITSSMRMAKNLTSFKVSKGYILICGSVHDLKLQPD